MCAASKSWWSPLFKSLIPLPYDRSFWSYVFLVSSVSGHLFAEISFYHAIHSITGLQITAHVLFKFSNCFLFARVPLLYLLTFPSVIIWAFWYCRNRNYKLNQWITDHFKDATHVQSSMILHKQYCRYHLRSLQNLLLVLLRVKKKIYNIRTSLSSYAATFKPHFVKTVQIADIRKERHTPHL